MELNAPSIVFILLLFAFHHSSTELHLDYKHMKNISSVLEHLNCELCTRQSILFCIFMHVSFGLGDDWEHEEIFTDDDEAVGNDPEEREDLLAPELPAPPEIKQVCRAICICMWEVLVMFSCFHCEIAFNI